MKLTPEQLLEKSLGRAANRQGSSDDDDITTYGVVLPDGRDVKTYEKRHDVEYDVDPQNPDMPMPVTRVDIRYQLDDLGRPFQNIVESVAECKYGCVVGTNTLFICRWCRRNLCRRHTLYVGKRTYCRKGWCLVLGGPYKVLWTIYRLARYCIRTITGLSDSQSGSSVHTGRSPEEELFNPPPSYSSKDLPEMEKE